MRTRCPDSLSLVLLPFCPVPCQLDDANSFLGSHLDYISSPIQLDGAMPLSSSQQNGSRSDVKQLLSLDHRSLPRETPCALFCSNRSLKTALVEAGRARKWQETVSPISLLRADPIWNLVRARNKKSLCFSHTFGFVRYSSRTCVTPLTIRLLNVKSQ